MWSKSASLFSDVLLAFLCQHSPTVQRVQRCAIGRINNTMPQWNACLLWKGTMSLMSLYVSMGWICVCLVSLLYSDLYFSLEATQGRQPLTYECFSQTYVYLMGKVALPKCNSIWITKDPPLTTTTYSIFSTERLGREGRSMAPLIPNKQYYLVISSKEVQNPSHLDSVESSLMDTVEHTVLTTTSQSEQ